MNRIDDQIEADVELHARVVEGVEAALIGRELFRVGIAVGDEEGRDQQRQADDQRHADEDDDGQIGAEQFVHCLNFLWVGQRITIALQPDLRNRAAGLAPVERRGSVLLQRGEG